MESEALEYTCRTCLVSNNCELDFVDLSSYLMDSLTYLDCLNFCTNLGATTSDNLPIYICNECCEALEIAYDFINKSKNADDLLRLLHEDCSKHEKDTIQNLEISFESHNVVESDCDSFCEEIYVDTESDLKEIDWKAEKPKIQYGGTADKIREKFNEDINIDIQEENGCANVKRCKLNDSESDSKDNQNRKDPLHSLNHNRTLSKNERYFPAELEELSSNNELTQTADGKTDQYQKIERPTDGRNKALKTKKSNPIYKCEECSETFKNMYVLKTHVKKNHRNGKQYNAVEVCDICNLECKAFTILAHRRSHFRTEKTTQGVERPFLCSMCPKQYREKHTLMIHQLNAHPDNNAKLFQCEECPSSFKCKEYLARHERTVHVQRKLKCHLCGSLFKLQFQLKAHLKRHTDRNYQCEQCDKSYPREVELKIHMRTHTGERPFKCTMCEDSFRTATRLSVHFAAQHAKEKTKCPHCGLIFEGGKTSKYYTHMYQHNAKGMPYKCEKCPLECDTRYHMRRHMKSAHKINISTKELIKMFHKNMGRYARQDLQKLDDIINDSIDKTEYEQATEKTFCEEV